MRTITHLRRTIFALTLFCLPAQGGAKTTFEALPEGTTPTDNAPLVSPYTDGPTLVSFGFDTNGDFSIDVNARFERRGPDTLFAYQTNLGDDADKTATQEGGIGCCVPPRRQNLLGYSVFLGKRFPSLFRSSVRQAKFLRSY
jgi:hypothetical protein